MDTLTFKKDGPEVWQRTDLDAGLADVDGDYFTHDEKG